MPINNPQPLQTTDFGRSLITQSNARNTLEFLGFPNLGTIPEQLLQGEVVARSDRQGFAIQPRNLHAAWILTSNQSIPSGVTTAVSFNQILHNAVWGGNPFAATLVPTRLSVRKEGLYLVLGQVYFENNTSGITRSARIQKTSQGVSSRIAENRALPVNFSCLSIASVHSFLSDDFVELQVFQDSGNSLSVLFNSYFLISQIFV